jgi:hypothetical protein
MFWICSRKKLKVPCFSNFFGKRSTEKTLARIGWKTQLVCLLHGCCFIQRTHLLDCRGASPNSTQLQKLQVANFSANMLLCAELKQKVRLFLVFEGRIPSDPRKSLKKLCTLCQFFWKKINLTKTDSLKIKFESWRFLRGKIHTRISFSEFSIVESVASIQREREREHSMATWIVFTISCVLLFLTFFSWPI